MDLVNARHQASFDAGQHEAVASEPESKSEVEQPLFDVEIAFNDQRSVFTPSPGVDESIFNNWKLPIDSDLKADFKSDVATRIGRSIALSPSQLRAIMSAEPAIAVEGGAACGKTTVIAYRALVLHRYLNVQAEQICIICTDTDSKAATAATITALFEAWLIPNAAELSEKMVKTLPEAVLDVARSVPGMTEARLFESGREGAEAACNPYAPRLAAQCYEQMDTFAAALYRSNRMFAQAVVDLFKQTQLIEPLEADHPEVIKRSGLGWTLESTDAELTAQVQSLWASAGVWPIAGVTPAVTDFDLCGRTFRCHGYIEQLDAYVVLGFDRTEDRNLKRSPQARLEMFKEVEVKKTIIRAYADKPIIHLDSYQQAKNLASTLASLATVIPAFRLKTGGREDHRQLSMAIWDAVSFVELAGLDVRATIARTNFMPGDREALFYKVVSIYWTALEKSLLDLDGDSMTMTFGRMLSTFSGSNGGNLRFAPLDTLSRYKHMLVDDAQDLSPAGAGWIRSVLREQKRRALQLGAGRAAATTSLMFAGDPLGRMYGSRGASSQSLTGFGAFFGVPGNGAVVLADNFVSVKGLVDVSEAILAPIAQGRARQTLTSRPPEPGVHSAPISFRDYSKSDFESVILQAIERGSTVLVVPDQPETYSQMAAVLLPFIESEKRKGGRKQIFVRQAAKAGDVDVDVLVLVGTFAGRGSSSFHNQVFKLAGQGGASDIAPYETAIDEDGLAGAASSIARARESLVWFSSPEGRGYSPETPIGIAKRACEVCRVKPAAGIPSI